MALIFICRAAFLKLLLLNAHMVQAINSTASTGIAPYMLKAISRPMASRPPRAPADSRYCPDSKSCPAASFRSKSAWKGGS